MARVSNCFVLVVLLTWNAITPFLEQCVKLLYVVVLLLCTRTLATGFLASIPAPLTRGPGNHRLRVGAFNSKFVSKTLSNSSINLLYYGHPRG